MRPGCLRCQFILASGKQCSRYVCKPSGGKYCWQHANATPKNAQAQTIRPATIKKKAPAATKGRQKKPAPAIQRQVPESDKVDYRSKAIKKVIDGYDVLVLPKGTILWHGTSAAFPDKIVPTPPAYFGNIADANWYAFASDEHRGAKGKITSFKTTRAVTLIDITQKSLARLSQREGFDREDFEYAFAFGREKIRRVSHPLYDKPLSEWICGQRLFDGWTGSYDRKDAGFHPEVLLCVTKGIVTRNNAEYRFDPEFPKDLFRMKGSKIDAIVPENSFGDIHWNHKDTLFGDKGKVPRWLRNGLQATDKAFTKEVLALEANDGAIQRK
jgi:hypothetical protein